MGRDAADGTEDRGARGDSLLYTDLQRLLRLLSAYLQMHRLTPTAYDVVRRPRCVLLVINTTPENRGGDR